MAKTSPRKAARPALAVVAEPARPTITMATADELARTLRHLDAAINLASISEAWGDLSGEEQASYLCMCWDLVRSASNTTEAMISDQGVSHA